jgi:WhiB family redox-sensing transcriptional regulator
MTKRPAIINLAIQGKLELLDRDLGTPAFFSDANCKDADPTLFFAESNSKIAQAKEVCASCPIQQMCLDWAMQNAEDGVYGSTTPRERKKLRKGADIIDINEIRLMKEQRELILNSALDTAIAYFHVNERTIYRWRQMLNPSQKAS